MPRPAPPWQDTPHALPPDLARLLGQAQTAFLFDERFSGASGAERQRRERLVRSLIAGGFRTVVAPPERLALLRALCVGADVPPVFFAEAWEPLTLPRTPVLVIDPPDVAVASIRATAESDGRTPLVVWLDAERRDPEKRHCLLRHTVPGQSFRLEEFCRGVGV
jgi:hypothetical protein